MKTVLLNIPDKNEKWSRSLFTQLHLKRRILSKEEKEDMILAKLIDEAMSDEGEVNFF